MLNLPKSGNTIETPAYGLCATVKSVDLEMQLTLLVPSHFTLSILCENTKNALYYCLMGIYEKVVHRVGRGQKMVFHFSSAPRAQESLKVNPGAL